MRGIDFIVLFFLIFVTLLVVPISDRVMELDKQLDQRQERLSKIGK